MLILCISNFKETLNLFPAVNKSLLIKPEILNTLTGLQLALQRYFSEFAGTDKRWVINLS